MNRTLAIFVGLLLMISVTMMAAQGSKRFYLSNNATVIEEKIDEQTSQALLSIPQLIDSCPQFYPHSPGQVFVNKEFHMISVSPDDKRIAFVSGEGDQWLGTIDTKERIYKFILFGLQTSFIDALWSPDSRYLAYAFKGPDRRLVLHVIEPPALDQDKPRPMNGWQYNTKYNEKLRMIGWKADKDTAFLFEVLDSTGRSQEKVTLPLHRSVPAGPLKSRGK